MERRIKLILALLAFVILLILGHPAYCTEYHAKQWTVGSLIGSFLQNPKLKYYVEPQLRLIDDEYVFNQVLFLTGLGYQLLPTVMIFVGPGLVITKNTESQLFHEYRLWEQLNWQVLNNSSVVLNSRTRLEQKERSNESQIAIQLRERLWLRIPIKNSDAYYYSLFDEGFFNFNHPSWTSPHFFEQNRAFIGLGKQLTKNTTVDVGYLNQLQFGPPRRLSNVFWLNFNIVI